MIPDLRANVKTMLAEVFQVQPGELPDDLIFGDIPPASTSTLWLTWWIGNLLGVLVVTPFILIWVKSFPDFLENEEKRPLFSVAERVETIRELVGGDGFCRVASFSGLLVDFVDAMGAKTIVRGLRAVSDFEYEFQMALMNRHLSARVETVFLMPKAEYSYLSCRLVKEVFRLGGNLDGAGAADADRAHGGAPGEKGERRA